MLEILKELLNTMATGTNVQQVYPKARELLNTLESEFAITEDSVIAKEIIDKVDLLEDLYNEVKDIESISTQEQAQASINNLDDIKATLQGYAIVASIDTHMRTINERSANFASSKSQADIELDKKTNEFAPICDSCNIKMVYRENRQNGDAFWGCPNFPVDKGGCEITKNLNKEAKKSLGIVN